MVNKIDLNGNLNFFFKPNMRKHKIRLPEPFQDVLQKKQQQQPTAQAILTKQQLPLGLDKSDQQNQPPLSLDNNNRSIARSMAPISSSSSYNDDHNGSHPFSMNNDNNDGYYQHHHGHQIISSPAAISSSNNNKRDLKDFLSLNDITTNIDDEPIMDDNHHHQYDNGQFY